VTTSFDLEIERLRDEDLIERLNKRDWGGRLGLLGLEEETKK